MLAGSGRPRKACNACKRLKVRCSGDRPACKRCIRLKHECVYVNLADTSPSFDRGYNPSTAFLSIAAPLNQSARSSNPAHVAPAAFASQHWTLPPPINPGKVSLGIPKPLVAALVDVYFTHVYNASLLLHRPSFLHQLDSETVAPASLFSICALAAIFYRDSKGNYSLRDHGFAVEWATTAGKLALQDVETPIQRNVAVHLTLALFWYSHGAWRRSFVHKAIAVQIVHTLGLGLEKKGRHETFESEMRRRRFWACYLVNCHGADHTSSTFSASQIDHVALPWHEKDFASGNLSRPLVTLRSTQSNGGVWAELVRALSIWSSVYDLIKSMTSDMNLHVPSIHSLDTQIENWWAKVPYHMKLTKDTASEAEAQILPKLVLINAVYHQSLCALHASNVPLFSLSSNGRDENCGVATQISAQIAFDHACDASAFFELVMNSSDSSATPSFVAYAAYCSCAIQIPFLWSSDNALQEQVKSNIKTNVRMIHIVGNHWKFAALLAIHVQYLYGLHHENRSILEGEPKLLALSKLRGFRVSAQHARESILSHNGILWARGEGCAEQGDEVFDLGIDAPTEPDSADLPQASETRLTSETPATGPWSDLRPEGSSAEGPQTSDFVGPDRNCANSPPPITNLDYFHPFLDSENFDMFADRDCPDFSLATDVDLNFYLENGLAT